MLLRAVTPQGRVGGGLRGCMAECLAWDLGPFWRSCWRVLVCVCQTARWSWRPESLRRLMVPCLWGPLSPRPHHPSPTLCAPVPLSPQRSTLSSSPECGWFTSDWANGIPEDGEPGLKVAAKGVSWPHMAGKGFGVVCCPKGLAWKVLCRDLPRAARPCGHWSGLGGSAHRGKFAAAAVLRCATPWCSPQSPV